MEDNNAKFAIADYGGGGDGSEVTSRGFVFCLCAENRRSVEGVAVSFVCRCFGGLERVASQAPRGKFPNCNDGNAYEPREARWTSDPSLAQPVALLPPPLLLVRKQQEEQLELWINAGEQQGCSHSFHLVGLLRTIFSTNPTWLQALEKVSAACSTPGQ